MDDKGVFQLCSHATLERLTGRKAYTLAELHDLIKSCSESSIFFHTLSAFRRLREVKAPFTSDFALWVAQDLQEDALAEKLEAVDLIAHQTLENLRTHVLATIDDYRKNKPAASEKTADDPFYLIDITRIVYLTDKFAYDLKTFRDLIEGIRPDSMYHHFIESRLKPPRHTDDFSPWIEENLKLPDLAQSIREIDFYVHTLDDVKEKICQLIDEHMEK